MFRKISVVLAFATFLIASAVTAEPFKVAFVYASMIRAFGWTHQHEESRQIVDEVLKGAVNTVYVEDVKDEDAENVIRTLAASGNRIIFVTSYGFEEATLKVAQEFPDVKFEVSTGRTITDNVSTYAMRFYESRYVATMAAAMVSKTGKIGYIASVPIPEVIRGINVAALAARKVNPEAVVIPYWLYEWSNIEKEAEAANWLIDQGADVITQHTSSTEPIKTAEARGVYAVGKASNLMEYGPTAHVTSTIDDWSGYYIATILDAIDGTWHAERTWGGMATGMMRLAPYNTDLLSPEQIDRLVTAHNSIRSSDLNPFDGPIYDQNGDLVVPDGETLGDLALRPMDWYVQGVQGEIPK